MRGLKRLAAAGAALIAAALGGCDDSADHMSITVSFDSSSKSVLGQTFTYWKDLVEQRSHGRLTLSLHPEGVDGGPETVLMNFPTTEHQTVTCADFGTLANFGAPELSGLAAPYLFSSKFEYEQVLADNWYSQQIERLRNNDIEIIGTWYLGWRITMLDNRVNYPAESFGRRVFTGANLGQTTAVKVMDLTPVPAAYSVLKSMSDSIKGMENTLWYIYDNGFVNRDSRIFVDNHSYDVLSVVMSRNAFTHLSEFDQALLRDTCHEAGIYGSSLEARHYQQIVEGLKERGIELVYLTAEQRYTLSHLGERFFSAPDLKAMWGFNLRHRLLKIAGSEK
ncbi:MAG: TRAP transporter substrate-binding protein DctP [Succinivibrionaceae bacterium]|nr:TRAP transporter substrate-binding protein DctP [Succinivibrionaceae bacterium]